MAYDMQKIRSDLIDSGQLGEYYSVQLNQNNEIYMITSYSGSKCAKDDDYKCDWGFYVAFFCKASLSGYVWADVYFKDGAGGSAGTFKETLLLNCNIHAQWICANVRDKVCSP